MRDFFIGGSSLLVCMPPFDSSLFDDELSEYPIPNPKPNKPSPVLIAKAVLSLSTSNGNSNNLFVTGERRGGEGCRSRWSPDQ